MWFRCDLRSFSRASSCAALAVGLVLAARVQAEPPNSTPAQRPVSSLREALRLGLLNDLEKPVVGEQIRRSPIRALDMIEGPPVGDSGPVRFRFGGNSFCSGFEPPCTLGYIGGGGSGVPQNCEWHASNNVNNDPPPTQPVIDNSNPFAGEQHLHFEFDPAQSPIEPLNWAFSDDIPNPPVDGVMTLNLMLYISETGGLNDYFVRPQAPSQSLVTAMMQFDRDGTIWCYEFIPDPDDPDNTDITGFPTGFTWVPGEYKAVSICIDNVNNRIRYFYDGDLVYSTGVGEGGQESGIFAATTIEHVLIRYGQNENTDPFMDVDEVCIEPDNCTLPTGACCNIDGEGGCLRRTETACGFSETGVWAGLNTDCSPELCNAAQNCGLQGSGSCFDPTGTPSPGCAEFDCCIDVCVVNPECCDVIWDGACAAAAFEICSVPCTNSEPECQDIGVLDAFNATVGEFKVADNFTPSTDTTIQSLCWAGAYFENASVEDSFTVSYYDCVDGVPGNRIAEYSEANAELFVGKGDTGLDTAGGLDVYEYVALHSPLAVNAGQAYFIEISNAPPGGEGWLWETMAITDTDGDGEYFQALYGEDYARYHRGCRADMSFCLNVELGELIDVCDVPLPTECLEALVIPDAAIVENEACGDSDNDQCDDASSIIVSHDPTEPTFISGQAFAASGQGDSDWYKFDVQDLDDDNEAVICVTIASELPMHVALVEDLAGDCTDLSDEDAFPQAVSLPCEPLNSIAVEWPAPGEILLRARVADGCDVVEGYTCPNDYVLQIAVANTVEECTGCGLFTCPADLNDDGVVGAFDLAVLLGAWGPCPAKGLCCSDQSKDGDVGPLDLANLLGAWGPCLAALGACCNIDGEGACEQLTPSACEEAGGTPRGAGQKCSSCPPISCGAGSGDCCAANGTAGCEIVGCCSDVCELDASCCDVEWTAACALLAEDLCDPCAPPPVNDNCADALVVGDGDTSFDTSAATTDGPPHAQCQFDGQTYNDVWYDYTATCTADLTVSTCNQATYDTDLVIYDGCSCPLSDEELLGCNDDTPDCAIFTSELVVPVTTGNCYKIRIGGWGAGNSGTGTVSVTCGGG